MLTLLSHWLKERELVSTDIPERVDNFGNICVIELMIGNKNNIILCVIREHNYETTYV